jgi:hypothetical protein
MKLLPLCHSILLYLFTVSTILFSCSSQKKQENQAEASKDTVGVLTTSDVPTDTLPAPEIPTKSPSSEFQEPEPPKSISKKACDVTFSLLASPEKNHHIFQVNSFNAEEFECWAALENHGIRLCGDNLPCTITYVEPTKMSTSNEPSHAVNDAALKKHGIGRFEYKNSWWELRGAKIWQRTEKGFDYYNSNRY